MQIDCICERKLKVCQTRFNCLAGSVPHIAEI